MNRTLVLLCIQEFSRRAHLAEDFASLQRLLKLNTIPVNILFVWTLFWTFDFLFTGLWHKCDWIHLIQASGTSCSLPVGWSVWEENKAQAAGERGHCVRSPTPLSSPLCPWPGLWRGQSGAERTVCAREPAKCLSLSQLPLKNSNPGVGALEETAKLQASVKAQAYCSILGPPSQTWHEHSTFRQPPEKHQYASVGPEKKHPKATKLHKCQKLIY